MRDAQRTKSWRTWHRRVGVTGALLWLAISATGVALTFRTSLRPPPPVAPKADSLPPASVEEIERDLHARFDPLQIRAIDYPSSSSPRWRAQLSSPAGTVVYYSVSGAHLETRVHEKALTQLLFRLHTGAVLGRAGELAAAGFGVLLVGMIISGFSIWPWWIRKRRYAARASAKRAAPQEPTR